MYLALEGLADDVVHRPSLPSESPATTSGAESVHSAVMAASTAAPPPSPAPTPPRPCQLDANVSPARPLRHLVANQSRQCYVNGWETTLAWAWRHKRSTRPSTPRLPSAYSIVRAQPTAWSVLPALPPGPDTGRSTSRRPPSKPPLGRIGWCCRPRRRQVVAA